MRLEWSGFALEDRNVIFDFIEADSPRAAILVDERIEAASDYLTSFPEAGRPGRVTGTRERVVSGLPYILAYVIDGEVVRILRVLHAAQGWPDSFPS